MNALARLLRYCRLHLFRDPRYFLCYVVQYRNPRYVPNIRFYSDEEVGVFVSGGKSLIRLGDGEIYVLNHGDIPFERSTPELRKLMLASIREYHSEAPYIMALNRVPLQKTNQELKNKEALTSWLPSKVYYNLYFNKEASYADAAMFYFKETIPKYFEAYLKTKRIIFVSNKQNCDQFIANMQIPFEHTQVIVTPDTGSFSKFTHIKNEVQALAELNGMKNVVVLAACGPASKVLAFELSKIGIQVLDVGQGITAAYTDCDHSLSENIRVLQ